MSLTSAEITYNKRVRNKQIIRAAKSVPCADCGIQYPHYVMEFDHRNGKRNKQIPKMLMKTVKQLLDEIAKCDVVCGNCHNTRTWFRANPLAHFIREV